MSDSILPWLVMLGYGLLVWWMAPRSATPGGFFGGGSNEGRAPGLWLLIASAAISWIFAKSIANSAGLAYAFGLTGSIGYAIYYLSFLTAGIAIYLIRTRAGDASLPAFLIRKYGSLCAKLFIAAIAQMILAAILLGGVMWFVMPDVVQKGIPQVPESMHWAGLTFCGLALVQVLSYPFHDPVLTDRGFITSPKVMLKGFILAGFIAGSFIFLFGFVGLYALGNDLQGNPTLSVPAQLGLPLLLMTNAIMLTSAGSTLDSTFASTAKLFARDLPNKTETPTDQHVRWGRYGMIAIAVLGNIPLLGIYWGDHIGPAIIAATTISGTMVMGLAPIFLLSFVSGAGPVSFHLAFWPGLVLGILVTVEGVTGAAIFPAWVDIGSGKYADDLGINLYGLMICTAGFLAGCLVNKSR